MKAGEINMLYFYYHLIVVSCGAQNRISLSLDIES